jgi:hypothetical protein
MSPACHIIDADTLEFLQRRVSIVAAGRDGDNVPSSARAYGCRVRADHHVTVFVRRSQAAQLLRDVESNGELAVVFTRPTTNRALQFKGRGARVGALEPGDIQVITEWVGSLVVELAALGISAPLVHAAFAVRPDDMSAITFVPGEGFAQTPGPGAGARLASGGAERAP